MVFRFVLMRLSCFAGWTFFFIKTQPSMALKNLWEDVLDLIFPPLCPACTEKLRSGQLITCLDCFDQLPWFSNHNTRDNPITDRMAGRLLISDAIALLYFIKEGLSQRLIHQIKYNGDKHTAFAVGKLLAHQMMEKAPSWDLIVPVPLHKSKLYQRGFNQSEVFGAGLAEGFHLPLFPHVLHRSKKGQTQAAQGQESRFATVFQNFEIRQPEVIQNKHILLVDDVLTTGATLESCGSILLQQGARSVSLAVMAVTPV